MEHCFRIALWMLFLVGCLQANPVDYNRAKRMINMGDLGLDFLDEVSCGNNVTFISPTNVQKHCHDAALECFIRGLNHAKTNCTDELDRTLDTLESLEQIPRKQTDSSDCNWEKESRKTFAEFVNDLRSLIELHNSN